MSFFSIDDFRRWQKWMIENGYMLENEHEFLMDFLYTQAFEKGNLQLRSSEENEAILEITDYYYTNNQCYLIIPGIGLRMKIKDVDTGRTWTTSIDDIDIVSYFYLFFRSLFCESDHIDRPDGTCTRCARNGRFRGWNNPVSVQNLTMPWVFNTRRWVMS